MASSLSGSQSVKKPLGASTSVRNKKAAASAALMTTNVDGIYDPDSFDISSVGWNNIEQRFYDLKAMLSAPTSGLNANQARVKQKSAVSIAIGRLLDTAQLECRKLLIEGNAKAAVEGGLKTLKLKEEYYGSTSLQLVPAYFHLARTNQFMDKFKNAEEFLSLAQWIILRHPEADVSLKAELHQTFGLLYASDSKLDAALKQLTCATYYLCQMNGPEHILTSFGYFDLGNVFAAKSNMENAMAFYDRVKESWLTHLSAVLRENATNPEGSSLPYSTPAQFGEENLQDAVKMLRGIVALQTERYGRVHPSTARAEEVLGMYLLWNGDAVSALSCMLRALEISKRVFGERHPTCSEIRSLLLTYGLQVPDDTSNVLDADTDMPNAEEVPPPAAAEKTEAKEEFPPPPADEPAAQQTEEAPAATEEPAAPAEEAAPAQPTSSGEEPPVEEEVPEAKPTEEEAPAEETAAASEAAAAEETAVAPSQDKAEEEPVAEPESTAAEQPAPEEAAAPESEAAAPQEEPAADTAAEDAQPEASAPAADDVPAEAEATAPEAEAKVEEETPAPPPEAEAEATAPEATESAPEDAADTQESA